MLCLKHFLIVYFSIYVFCISCPISDPQTRFSADGEKLVVLEGGSCATVCVYQDRF